MESLGKIRLFYSEGEYTAKGTDYTYIRVALPKPLLEAANIRPEDKLLVTLDENDRQLVQIKYAPEDTRSRSFRKGIIHLNQAKFNHTIHAGAKAEVDFKIVQAAVVFRIPDEMFDIPRGFDLIQQTQHKGFDFADIGQA